MLAAAGLDAGALECGTHWPSHQPSAQLLARTGGQASPLHNNCSGKHAGFLCTACALGVPPRGYVSPQHPVQQEVKAVLEQLSGTRIEHWAVDGCSVPTWAMPLAALALAFARFGTGHGLGEQRAKAAMRLRKACAEKPWFTAGTGRFCTKLMERFGTRVYVKGGAEGMFCAALPDQGYGIAVKCDDGASRAAEVMMAATIARLLPCDDGERAFMTPLVRPELRNWNGIDVGGLRPTETLLPG
jgi:L-asparaginase II